MTMTGLLLYCAVGLMVLTVVSNRYWRSQLARTRRTVRRLQEDADTLAKDLDDEARSCTDLGERFAEAERRTARAEQQAIQTEAELEAMQQAAVERYYVFDRQEPRSGRFWEAAIRRAPEEGRGPRIDPPSLSWIGARRYLLIADNEREARERVGARFRARAGFEVVELVPCRLAALAINRGTEAAAGGPGNSAEREADDTGAVTVTRQRPPPRGLPRRAATAAARG